VIVAVVVYFLVGLMLLSHGQLAILRARWALEQTPTRSTILRYWPAYAVVLLIVIGLLAALMPFGGTYWLARIISAIFGAVYFVVFFIFQIFAILFAMIMSLFPSQEAAEAPPPAPLQPMAPPPQQAPPSEFLEMAGSTVFWLIALLIVGYAAYVYFTDKGIRFTWITWLWQLFRSQWRQMTTAYGSWQSSRVDGEGTDERGRSGRKRRWFPWQRRQLDPNGWVRFYYHAMLDEAGAKGIVRQKAETPLRFAPRLTQTFADDPSATEAVDGLTGAFIDVRYAEKRMADADLPPLEQFWKTLRRMLRR